MRFTSPRSDLDKTWGDEPYRALSAALKICNVCGVKIIIKNQNLKYSRFASTLGTLSLAQDIGELLFFEIAEFGVVATQGAAAARQAHKYERAAEQQKYGRQAPQ
jgi:hypothetical protein